MGISSSTQKLLQVSYLSTDFSWRTFSYSSPGSPVTWYSIPTSIKNCSSLYTSYIAQLINN